MVLTFLLKNKLRLILIRSPILFASNHPKIPKNPLQTVSDDLFDTIDSILIKWASKSKISQLFLQVFAALTLTSHFSPCSSGLSIKSYDHIRCYGFKGCFFNPFSIDLIRLSITTPWKLLNSLRKHRGWHSEKQRTMCLVVFFSKKPAPTISKMQLIK